MIDIHPQARVSALSDIEDSLRGSRILVAAHAVIDSFVKVKPAGGVGDLVVGERSIINSGCVLYTGNGIVIGCDVAIAANCTFAPVNHAYCLMEQCCVRVACWLLVQWCVVSCLPIPFGRVPRCVKSGRGHESLHGARWSGVHWSKPNDLSAHARLGLRRACTRRREHI